MLSNISDLFTMASLVICMLLSGIIFYYLRTRISMLEQSVMDQAQLLQQVVTSLKSSQYRQQQMNASANASVISAQQQDLEHSDQRQANLIQVSDDSDDSDNSDSDDDTDDSESDDGYECGNALEDGGGGSCKIIDLSTISSSANYLKSSSSHSEIKVIELKSNIHSGNDYIGNSIGNSIGSSDDDEDDDEDEDEDEDEEEEEEEEEDDEEGGEEGANEDEGAGKYSDEQMKNDTRNENVESKNDELDNQSHVNVNTKKFKSIIIEDPAGSVSLDEMKNIPVNSLRSLAKTKLGPATNKMSKKEILKALHD